MSLSISSSSSGLPRDIQIALTNSQVAINALDSQYGNKDDKLQALEFANGINGSTELGIAAGQTAAKYLLDLETKNSFSSSLGGDVISRKALAAYHLTIYEMSPSDSKAFNEQLAAGKQDVLEGLERNYARILSHTGSASAAPSRTLTDIERTALANALTWTAAAQNPGGITPLENYAAAHVGNTGSSQETGLKAARIVDQNGDGRTDLLDIMAYYLTAYTQGGQFNSQQFNNQVAAGSVTDKLKASLATLMAYFQSPF